MDSVESFYQGFDDTWFNCVVSSLLVALEFLRLIPTVCDEGAMLDLWDFEFVNSLSYILDAFVHTIVSSLPENIKELCKQNVKQRKISLKFEFLHTKLKGCH